MSLLTYASPWTSDSSLDKINNAVSRKRTPTMGGIQSVNANSNSRKTVKVRPSHDSTIDQYEIYKSSEIPDDQKVEIRGSQVPESIDQHLEKQTERNTKINSVLNKITSFSTGDKLGDFNPMPYPTIITKRNSDQVLSADEKVENGVNPLMPKSDKPTFIQPSIESKPGYFRAAEPNAASQYANYRDAYGKDGLTINSVKDPYYAKMGISGSRSDDKMMDRLNYMTQMLESLQMEKTNHVTEEFVLYSLLGVFMIYIVDGFSRGGKYVR